MNLQSTHVLVSQLAGKRILILGDVILDEYIWGRVERISQEAPIPVVEIQTRTCRPGGAANVAVNVVALGCKAQLCAVIGGDASGEKLTRELARNEVDVGGLLVCAALPTTTKSRVMAQNQQIVRLDDERATPLTTELEDRLLEWIDRQVPLADACVLSDYAKGVVTPRMSQEFIRRCRAAKKPVIVDPKQTDFSYYSGATVIKPNVRETERVLNRSLPDQASIVKAGAELATNIGDTALLITCGMHGMMLFRGEQPPLHLPSVARQVFDVTGAGDTVVSVLAISLAGGLKIDKAVELANVAAGIVVTKIGTATVSLQELAG
jgi:D-beta-D-heptose 7-phosphate kinase/D-beta-D-heptose 1-phosphate adenosyltransferase